MAVSDLRVLVVDSDRKTVSSAKSAFLPDGIFLMTAANAAEALRLLEAGLRPDVIFATVKLPDRGGFELLRAVRANPDWHELPFVLLSTTDEPEIRQRAFELGASECLLKPLAPAELLAAARIYARRARTPEPGHEGAPSTFANSNGTSSTPRRDLSAMNGHGLLPDMVSRRDERSLALVGSELKTYWRILRERRWTVIGCVMTALIVTLGVSALLTPRYSATATLRVASASGGEIDWGANALATRLSNTYVELATSGPVLGELTNRLGHATLPDIAAEVVPETELLRITARHTDPAIARDGANLLADIMVKRSLTLYSGDAPSAREVLWEQVQQAEENLQTAITDYNNASQEYEARIAAPDSGAVIQSPGYLDILARSVTLYQQIYAELLQRYENARVNEQLRANAITIAEPAELPSSPSSPRMLLNGMLALAGGLALGVLLAFLQNSFDTTLQSSEEIADFTAVPVLSRVPEHPYGRRLGIGSRAVPSVRRPRVAEAFELLNIRLALAAAERHIRTVIVTSAEPGAGKSTVAANLAIALAQAGNDVMLLDADLRVPRLHHLLKSARQPGLSDVMLRSVSAQEAILPTRWAGLTFLPAGTPTADYAGITSTAEANILFQTFCARSRFLIIDTPSLLSTSYTTLLAKHADAVLLVAARRSTERADLSNALRQLSEVGANVIGIVFNRVQHTQAYRYYSGHGVKHAVSAISAIPK